MKQYTFKGGNMAKLGVKSIYDMETNKRIIAKAWLKNPYLTEKQVKYLLCVWKPSGNYEKAKELWDWFKRATREELIKLAKEDSIYNFI